MQYRKSASWGLVAVAGLAVLTGCDQLTRENFEMIALHHAEAFDVEQSIGDPDADARMRDLWLYTRPDKHLTVKIHFDNGGRVSRKEWIDAMTNEWYDTQETSMDPGTSEITRVRTIE